MVQNSVLMDQGIKTEPNINNIETLKGEKL